MKKLTTKTCKKKNSRGEVHDQWLYVEFHKIARVQFKTRQAILDTTNSGHVKFKLRQECSCAYRDIADANGILLCLEINIYRLR